MMFFLYIKLETVSTLMDAFFFWTERRSSYLVPRVPFYASSWGRVGGDPEKEVDKVDSLFQAFSYYPLPPTPPPHPSLFYCSHLLALSFPQHESLEELRIELQHQFLFRDSLNVFKKDLGLH